jgi:hypothetical protein
MREQLRLGCSSGGKLIAQNLTRAAVQGLAAAPEQVLVGSVLNERVFKAIIRSGREPLYKQDVSVRELFQRGLQRRIPYAGDLTKKIIGEIAPNDRPDLRAGAKRQWGMESAKAGSARDSTVAAGCRLGSVIAVLAPKRAR